MANTYHKIYLQAVFAVKYREAVLEKEWRSKIFGVIGNIINNSGCKTIIVNGVEDHVHCFFGHSPVLSVSDLMKELKAISSKYINEQKLTPRRFEWQRGYGVFSYSRSQVEAVRRYIRRQEMHHEKRSLREEYLELLNKFQVRYDEKYIFHELL